jgi:tetratricopeptide (TPR) repeat protein
MAKGTLLAVLQKYIDPSMSLAVYSFVTMYFYLMMFNMMGYILYQYHEELGFSVDVDAHEHLQTNNKEEVAVSPQLRAIEILIHEGRQDQALKELQAIIKANPSDVEARDRMLKLVRITGHEMLHTEQARDFISYLIGESKMAFAARVFEAAYEYDKQFRPAKPVERLDMAKYLRQNNQGKLAMAILNNLHRDFPSFDRVPEAYLIVAQLLAEKFNDDERAIQVLEFVIKNYASHALRNEVEEYLNIIRASTS